MSAQLSFKDLNKDSNVEEAQKEIESSEKKSYIDNRFWTFEINKQTGIGSAIIRFLWHSKFDKQKYVKIYNHIYQNPLNGMWLIENCPTTIRKECPICSANSKLFKTGIKENQDLARLRKRQTRYISNILVVKNPKKPEDDGKVFLFKYGVKIFNKLTACMKAEFEDSITFDPWHFWKGANLKLRTRKEDGQITYNPSEFEPCSPISKDDSIIEEIWNAEFGLEKFLDPKNFKSYEELEKRFMDVESLTSSVPSPSRGIPSEYEFDNIETKKEETEDTTNKFQQFLNKNSIDSPSDGEDDSPF